MTPFDLAAMKAGWIPLLHEEPVYFKYDKKTDNYRIVFDLIKKDYYDNYNKWVTEGRITQESLDKQIGSCISNFCCCISTVETLQRACIMWVNDYKHHKIVYDFENPERIETLRKIKEFDKFIQTLK